MTSAAEQTQRSPLRSQNSVDLSGLVGVCDSSSTGVAALDPNWQFEFKPRETPERLQPQPQPTSMDNPPAAAATTVAPMVSAKDYPATGQDQQHLAQHITSPQVLKSPTSHTCVTTAILQAPVSMPGPLPTADVGGTTQPLRTDAPHASLQNQHQVATTPMTSAGLAADTAVILATQHMDNMAPAQAAPQATPDAAAAAATAAATGPTAAAAQQPNDASGALAPLNQAPGVGETVIQQGNPVETHNHMQLLTAGSLDAGSRQGSTNAAAASAAVASAATAAVSEPATGDGDDDGSGQEASQNEAATDSDDPSAAAVAAAAAAVTYGGQGTHICLVDGCSIDLTDLKPYFRRSKICPSHQSAPTVLLGGVVCRFCQQCTRCHPLDEFDGTKRSCRSQLAHHNKSRKHRRRCTPGSFYSTKRSKPHAAQAARAKARLLAAQRAAAAAAAAGGDTAAQQAAAAAAVAAAAAAAMAEAKSKKAAAQAASKRASASVAAAAAAAANRAVKTEAPTSSQAAGGAAASLVTRRAAAAAAAAMDEDLAAAAEAAASAAAAQHQRGMAAAMGVQGSYGMTADIWGRLDHPDVVSGAAGSGGTFHRFGPGAVSGHQSTGLDYSSGGYSMAQMQQMQQQQMQMQGLGSMGASGMMLNPRVPGNSMAGVCGPYTQAAGSGGAAGPLCGSGLLHGRATVSAGSGRMTQQQGEEDAGSSSCCSSRGSPMLSGARRQQRNLLLSASSAPTGSLAQYLHPGGMTGAAPLGSMNTMPPLPPTLYTAHQHQQQLLAANAAAAAGAAGPSGTVRSNSASTAYAAARAAAMAAATARSNGARGWRGLLPAEQAQVLLQAGGSSYDSCPDIWAGQPGSLDNSLAPGPNAAAAGSSPAGVYLMHKVGRSRMDQNPGSSARQAAAMAGYQALQQQQQQELEQLQLWHRIQTSRQVVTALGRGPADLAPIMNSADLAAAAATQGTSSQPMYPPCAGEVNSGMNAAMAAGMHGSMGPAAAGRLPPVRVVSTAAGGPMPGQVDFYQGQHPAGVSLPSTDARLDSQPGAKAARDAVAGDLLAMVNPADLLGDAQGPFDLGWHSMHAEGQMPAQTPPGASMQSHGQHHGHNHHGHFAHSSGLKAVVGARAGGPSSATAAAAAVAAAGVAPGVGLDAGDIADLWDVLEEYEGGDKESCDALFEHLTDLF